MSVLTCQELRNLSRTNIDELVDFEALKIKESVVAAAKQGYIGIYINLPIKLSLYHTEFLTRLKTVFPDSAIRILLPENILSILW
jgi:hypothetical protein